MDQQSLPSSELGKTRQAASIWWLFNEYSCMVVGNFVAENKLEIIIFVQRSIKILYQQMK